MSFLLYIVTHQGATLQRCYQIRHFEGDHLCGKPGNVRDFDSCQGNVNDFTKSRGNVREKSSQGKVA